MCLCVSDQDKPSSLEMCVCRHISVCMCRVLSDKDKPSSLERPSKNAPKTSFWTGGSSTRETLNRQKYNHHHRLFALQEKFGDTSEKFNLTDNLSRFLWKQGKLKIENDTYDSFLFNDLFVLASPVSQIISFGSNDSPNLKVFYHLPIHYTPATPSEGVENSEASTETDAYEVKIEDLPDTNHKFGKNRFKISNPYKIFTFHTKDHTDKILWIDVFQRAILGATLTLSLSCVEM